MRMFRTKGFGAGIGVGALAGALLLAGAPAASAVTGTEVCPRPTPTVTPVCVFDEADFSGLLENRPVWTPALSAGKNDKISSIVNDSDYRVRVFKDANYRGEWLEIGPRQSWVATPEWDNQISSYFMY
ncbi:peptidase inhibitor family I36 protein [Streptomyces sp. NPDC018029]|uniref:peptidase inhibitor family I36 protein n=1 Tax=Streptomyces sp. NPDC018029 TaxID=3365032 RepID=UPI0037B558E0